MILSLVQSSSTASLFPHKTQNPKFRNLCPATTTPLFPTSLLPGLNPQNLTRSHTSKHRSATRIHASLIDGPNVSAATICGYFALNALLNYVPPARSFISERRKLMRGWYLTENGTLRRRKHIVKSKSEGQCFLKAIASLLSEDDLFLDASSHKGCQIRRESAHGESVCCNNVRALFNELPVPHLILEITAFRGGPLGEKDYIMAEKLERLLRSSPSI